MTAVHEGNRIHVALTNMGGQRIEANLTGIAADSPTSISQRRLYYRDGEAHFENANKLGALSRVEVDGEETTIVSRTAQFRLALFGRRRV